MRDIQLLVLEIVSEKLVSKSIKNQSKIKSIKNQSKINQKSIKSIKK
jgi:hypothetical protein